MVDINLLPDNLREREEKAKRAAAKQPHEPVFTLTNPPPLKPPPVHRPVAPKPSPVTRAAQAAPPLPAPPPLPASSVAVVRPRPPVTPDEPLHAAPKVAADAARVNLLHPPTAPTVPAARPAPAPAAATAEAEAILSAAVKRELARSPVAIPPLPPRRRRAFWAWLRSLFRRHPHEQLPPVPKLVFVPPPKAPLAPRPLPAPAVKHPAPEKLKVPLPPSAPVAAAPRAGAPAPAVVPAAAPTHRRHWWAWRRRHSRPAKPIAATVKPTPSAVTPAVLHPPEPHARVRRHWWPWHRRPRAPHPPRPLSVLPAAVPHPPPRPVSAPRVPTPSLPQRHRRGWWAWLTSLFARHPRSPKLPPAPAAGIPRPALPVPKPPAALTTPPATASTPTAPTTVVPAAMPSPAQPPAPPRPVSTPGWPPRRGTPGVGAPPRVAAGPHPARGVVGRPVRTLAVNLIPSDLTVTADRRLRAKLIGLAAMVVASALVVVGLQQWVRWYEVQIGTQVKATEAQITQLTAAIAGYEQYRLEGDALQAQIKTVEAALARHLYWTKIFEKLEQYTLPEVYYTSFTASEDGSLILAAVGRDYQSVARQLVAFQEAKDFVASVTITSASADYEQLPPEVVAELRRTAPPDTAVAAGAITATHFQVALTLLPDVYLQQFVTQRAP